MRPSREARACHSPSVGVHEVAEDEVVDQAEGLEVALVAEQQPRVEKADHRLGLLPELLVAVRGLAVARAFDVQAAVLAIDAVLGRVAEDRLDAGAHAVGPLRGRAPPARRESTSTACRYSQASSMLWP